MDLLSQTIRQTEYFYDSQVAVLQITHKDLDKNKLNIEDACDFLDMTLDVHSTRLCILIIQLAENQYKLSFRSKKWDVAKLAEIFGGGGHKHSSGASLVDYTKNPKSEILKAVQPLTHK